MKRPLPSLKGQALALQARREHSRAELRRKLITHGRKRLAAEAAARNEGRLTPSEPEGPLNVFGEPIAPQDGPERVAADEPPDAKACAEQLAAEVEAVLDWLDARGYQSDARFVEARVHSRAVKHGQARIQQELSRLGVQMDPDTAAQLRATEWDRAREVWRKRFGQTSSDPAIRAKQMRFLAARGFSSVVIRRVVGARDDTE